VRPDATEPVYEGRLFSVVRERWGAHEREIVEHPGSVAVVAVDEEGYVTLVRQLREPARDRLLELPAGVIEPGEDPLTTAKRELAEETGLRGGDWRELARVWTSPGFLRESMHLFLAEGLGRGDADPMPDEEFELVRWPIDTVASHLDEIEDAKTLAGLLFLLKSRS
jgi:8-oxo-dGTP pyrophosphatase MutT (NUDIX family)